MDSLWRFGSQNEQVQFDVSAGELRRCGEVGYLFFLSFSVLLFLLKTLITKKGIFSIILTLTDIHAMQIRRWGNIIIGKLTYNVFTIHDITIDIT